MRDKIKKMHTSHQDIVPLINFVKIDSLYVVCHFQCKITKKKIVSVVPFEPYEGKIEITWKDMLFHPFKSYDRYYHTPITIYGRDFHETILLKAFDKVSDKFQWSQEYKQYISI